MFLKIFREKVKQEQTFFAGNPPAYARLLDALRISLIRCAMAEHQLKAVKANFFYPH